MKEVDKKRIASNNQRKLPAKSEKRDRKLQEKNDNKTVKVKETEKASSAKNGHIALVSDSNTGTEPSEVYESMVIDYVDDMYRSDESLHLKTHKMADKENKDGVNDHLSDLGNDEPNEDMEEESDRDTINDSVSSQGDSVAADDEKVERTSRVSRSPVKTDPSDGSLKPERAKSKKKVNGVDIKSSKSTPKKPAKASKETPKGTSKTVSENSQNVKVHPKPLSDSPKVVDDKSLEDTKEADILDESSHATNSVGSDDEGVNTEENGECKENAALNLKIEEMESRIEKLEEELREVAALEISLYSVVPEHGSSAHKVHTPARRLCRLYIHACKYWSPNKRATVARNAVSGLVLIAKSCGNDVPRFVHILA